MTRILGISGSLRQASFNTALLRAAQRLQGEHIELEVVTLHGIPLYDGDVEARQGIPEAVATLKQKVAASHGVLMASPEYNNSVPGVLKNAIDWLSRPPDDIKRLFTGRPWAVIGASAGGFGTILAQNAWLGVLRHLGAHIWTGDRLLVSKAAQAFDAQGQLTDAKVVQQVEKFLAGFAAFADPR